MKKQLIALLLIAVMTVSVCTAVGVTTASRADAKAPTKLTLAKFHPTIGQYYLLFGVLTDGRGHRLSGKIVQLWYRRSFHYGWELWTTVRTDKSGVYGGAWDKRPGQHMAVFRGDRVYAPSWSNVV